MCELYPQIKTLVVNLGGLHDPRSGVEVAMARLEIASPMRVIAFTQSLRSLDVVAAWIGKSIMSPHPSVLITVWATLQPNLQYLHYPNKKGYSLIVF